MRAVTHIVTICLFVLGGCSLSQEKKVFKITLMEGCSLSIEAASLEQARGIAEELEIGENCTLKSTSTED